jgi:hypothetical protein
MSMLKRGVGALVLAAAGLTLAGTIQATRAAADEEVFAPPEAGFVPPEAVFAPEGCVPGGIASATTWDPLAFEKLTRDFIVESARYSPADRRITWTLRTKKTYPGELGVAERKLGDFFEDLFKKTFYCGNFYDAERRKIGTGEIYFTIGERGEDDRFLVFADLNVTNVEAITARIIITLCERPPEVKAPRPKDKVPPLD